MRAAGASERRTGQVRPSPAARLSSTVRARPRRPSSAGRSPRWTPPRVVLAGFAATIGAGTGLLLLPAATGEGRTDVVEALFTATSAVCVTGLIVVDTGTHWSGTGQAIILALIQVGGFGIMTMASLLGLLVSRRLGLSTRLTTAAETKSLELADVRRVVIGVATVSLLVEALVATVLVGRLVVGYGVEAPRALWSGVFHAVSAFNNAGFSLYPDSLMGFTTDPWVCLPVAGAVILGGIGFPVLFELRRELRRPGGWTVHTRITVYGSTILLVAGTAFFLVAEWSNPATLRPLDVPGKLLAGFFQGGVMPRTAGFNSLDVAGMNTGTWLGTDVLMFIGGGSAGTAGGIKVTTFFVLGFVILAEMRGDAQVTAFHRAVPVSATRQALSVALLGVAAVVAPAIVFAMTTRFSLDEVLYEVVSAFATVGLSTGITPELPPAHQLVLVVLMFVGRTGTITLATALALRARPRMYRLPEERPVIG